MKKSWGGMRSGAGRKATWRSGECKAVKLPIALVDKVMRYARQLDAGEVPAEPVPETRTTQAPAQEDRGWEQIKQLVEEKQELKRKVLHLEEILAKERKQLRYRDAEITRLKAAIESAKSILTAGIAEHKKGVRRGFGIKDAESVLTTLTYPS